MSLEEYVAKLEHAHEGLLNTIGASQSSWLWKVHKNAKAHYDNLKREKTDPNDRAI